MPCASSRAVPSPFPPFQLRQVRDFSQLISGGFAFLRRHGRPLHRAILICCLPPLLFVIYLLGGAFNSIFGARPFGSDRDDIGGYLVLGAYAIGLLVALLLHALTHEFFRLYDQGQAMTTGLLLRRAFRKSLHYLGILVLTGLMLTGAIFLCVLVFALEEPVLNVVAVLVMIAAVLALLAMCSLASAAQALEAKGVAAALGRSWSLVRNQFWPTLGLGIVAGLIVLILCYLVQIIGSIVMVVFMAIGASIESQATLVPFFMALIFGLMFCVLLFTYPVPCACMMLKYCSRVEEEEGQGLRERIAGFGEL